jgi:hypothetical protein
MPLELTPIEEEVAFLKAILDAINSMVNFEVLLLHGSDPDSSMLFATRTHQQFFNIALVDFLSCTDKKAPVRQTSYLGALRQIADSPAFSVNDSIAALRTCTSDFVAWLEAEITVDIWFPSIGLQAPLHVSRLRYIKMTGDLSKHNLLRSIGVAEDLQRLLAGQGVQIELDAALLALEDFYAWFHDHVLNYHGSTIAEYLNNIRWSIYEYLRPEFTRSIVWESRESPKYRYIYPPGVASKFGQESYWELMNLVRSASPTCADFKSQNGRSYVIEAA